MISTLHGQWGLRARHGKTCLCHSCRERRRLRDLHRAEACLGTVDRITKAPCCGC